MRENNVRMFVEIGMAVALAAVLNFITLFRMPQGGSVNLEMLPILIIAFRWGGFPGMLTGLVYGLIQLILNPYIVHPVQLIMDYPLAYSLVGLTGFMYIRSLNKKSNKSSYINVFFAVTAGGLGRLLSHILSGVIFFSQYVPEGQNPWLYSTIYNASYMIPSLIISFIIIIPLMKAVILRDNN